LTSLAILIPVKSSGAKSRLAPILSPSERREFETLLLSGVLGALGEARLLRLTFVISSDKKILDLSAHMGAGTILEPRDDGVNSAVIRGVEAVGAPNAVLVLPSDLPLIRASEVRHLLSLREAGVELVIVPSLSFDGTNALLYGPATGLKLSYDDDSFWNHVGSGARKGLSVGISTELGLMFDLDSQEDFAALARSGVTRPAVAFAGRVVR